MVGRNGPPTNCFSEIVIGWCSPQRLLVKVPWLFSRLWLRLNPIRLTRHWLRSSLHHLLLRILHALPNPLVLPLPPTMQPPVTIGNSATLPSPVNRLSTLLKPIHVHWCHSSLSRRSCFPPSTDRRFFHFLPSHCNS